VSGGGAGAGPGRAIQLGVLLALGGLMWLVLQSGATARLPGAGTIASVGFLLLAGALTASLLELVGLPHLTGYLLAGAVAGPHVLHLVDHRAVADLAPVNALALSLIALAGGAELRLDGLKQGLRSLGWATLLHNLPVMLLVGGAFWLARPLIPFAQGLGGGAMLAVAMLWGVVATTRSPSATLGIISQTRARGPLTTSTINFVMSSDVVVVVVLAVALTLAEPMVTPGAALSTEAFAALGHELLGSLSVGVTLGLLLIAYLRFVGGRLLLVLVAIGLVLTQVMEYLQLDWLLVFIAAGFVVRNLSRHGDAFLHAIEGAGEVIYVVFFAIAGAHLDLPLLAQLWPVALLLAGARALATWGAGALTGRLAGDPPALRRWGFAGLISQAGLALGIATKVSGQFPTFGAGFASLAVAVVALNEVAGPILFKLAIVKAGEAGAAEPLEAGETEAPAPAEG
jgi:Kef-type K+ transport system membrane component KefB